MYLLYIYFNVLATFSYTICNYLLGSICKVIFYWAEIASMHTHLTQKFAASNYLYVLPVKESEEVSAGKL